MESKKIFCIFAAIKCKNMSIINNSHAIGVDSKNLVLKTRGTIHVKVGDTYHELMFRDNTPSEDENADVEETKEEYIYTVPTVEEVNSMEYPGDNKLIICKEDKTIFVTVEGQYVEIFSKPIEKEEIVEEEIEIEEIIESTDLVNPSIRGTMSGVSGTSIDFDGDSITTGNLSVIDSFTYPKNTITTYCARTTSDRTDYRSYNFIGMEKEVDELRIKPGTIVRSEVKKTVTVRINDYSREFDFSKEKTYIFFIWDDVITYNYL